MRMQLPLEELIGHALIDEDRRPRRCVRHAREQLGRVVFAPLPSVRAQIAVEGLLSPRTLLRRRNRRERRHRLVDIGIPQRERQGTVSTHRVTENSGARGVDRKVRFDERTQLVRYVGIHMVVTRPWLDGRIQVKTGSHTEVPGITVPRKLHTARAGVRCYQRNPQLGGDALRPRLDHERLLRAGQAGEVVQHRHSPTRAGGRLRRHVHREFHCACRAHGFVSVEADGALEGAILADDLKRLVRHCAHSTGSFAVIVRRHEAAPQRAME